MLIIYGTTNHKGEHLDTSRTLRGAKQHATRNKYTTVSKRIGYNAFIVAEKVKNKWIECSNQSHFSFDDEGNNTII